MDKDTSEEQSHKGHRKRKSGGKVSKKKSKEGGIDTTVDPRQRNPKAFAFHSVNKVAKSVRRTLDIQAKKQHLPDVDRTPLEPPPIVVAVVGPPKVGKSTLIRCLVKNFTREKLTNIVGPVTLVSGKHRRLTLIECNNDISSMLDIAKVADLILLLVDASFGFEMETFEFLNICQVHGFPKIMGVLTHLDLLKNTKQLRKTKKKLKHRFWTEIYQGAKLFYLSGMVNGEYQKTEVHNLGRFISVMKFQPLTWRLNHPYILADRMEDLTDPESVRLNSKVDRNICLYGFVRGSHFKNNSNIHIPGCGDYHVHDVSYLPDPCPLPDKQKRRTLTERETILYAPMSGLGGIVYDKDAVYIDLGGSHSHRQREDDQVKPSNAFLTNLKGITVTIDSKMAASDVTLFHDTIPLEAGSDPAVNYTSPRRRRLAPGSGKNGSEDGSENSDTDDEDDGDATDDDDDEDDEESDNENHHVNKNGHEILEDPDESDEEVQFESDEDDTDDDEEEVLPSKKRKLSGSLGDDEGGDHRWRDNLVEKARTTFYQHRETTKINYNKLIYSTGISAKNSSNQDDRDDDLGGMFKIRTAGKKEISSDNGLDCSMFYSSKVATDVDEILDNIKDCFVTGSWKTEDATALLQKDDELWGDFEDLETGETHKAGNGGENVDPADSEDKPTEGFREKVKRTVAEKRLEKKRRMKEMFDSQYDQGGEDKYLQDMKQTMETQTNLNIREFEKLDEGRRVQYEGYRPGVYVRVQVNSVPGEFVLNFDPTYPVILGALPAGEDTIGYVQTRMKKHRWYKRILKTRDPLVISLGWRRFQTVPLYSIQDHNMRNRMLKYTPEHMHCQGAFWGPITPQGTGFLAVQSLTQQRGFRVAATGVTLEIDKSMVIVKKLKLTGTPFKIYKKTAFIKGMFNTALEVAKFEGASLRSVSGLRGQVKKAIKAPDGAFRSTFEDKILLSDIVFVRTWYPVEVPKFYNPVTTLLMPSSHKTQWEGMKTVGELRALKGLDIPKNEDSLYKTIERPTKSVRPLVVPRELQRNLPFAFKPKTQASKKTAEDPFKKYTAVVKEPNERRASQLMKVLKTMHETKMKKRRVEMRQRASKHQATKAKFDQKKEQKHKEIKKKIFRVLGQLEKKNEKHRRKH